ncbi:MAG: DUF1576 domain-containing protein [Lachnospiraceae bacterium]|jgi:hypothetical protein|nr:DUF1576 domain-containing protein [Lachnospiraceae bacterium]
MGVKKLKESMNLTGRKQQFLFLAMIPLYFIGWGFALQPFGSIVEGLIRIVREPDFLITDYFVVGGIGAAFVNAGLLALASIGLIYFSTMDMSGHTITSVCLMFGFSLFGKNLLNIWLILLGVFLYSEYHKSPPGRYLYIGLYGTSLSPIITQLMHIEHTPFAVRVGLCVMTGIIIGFVLPPLSTHVHYAHKGYSLYNVGFAGGIIATVVVSLFKSFGFSVESRLIWYTGGNRLFAVILSVLFAGMIVAGLILGDHPLENYKNILKSRGCGGTDYLVSEGGCATMINMGVNGLFVTFFLLAVGADINGPTIGGIFTVVGFSATGKTVRNIAPVMMGVWLAGQAKLWSITDPSATLALLLSTTLAPIAGEFGVVAGLLAGFLHSSVALNVGIVYGGMNLYNNGFAGGIVAIFLVPVIQSVKDRQARARGGISL